MNDRQRAAAGRSRGGTSSGRPASASAALALMRLLDERGSSPQTRTERDAPPKPPHFAPEGQERHLPVHGGGALAGRPLRRQAQAHAVRRPAIPEEFVKGERFAFIKGMPSCWARRTRSRSAASRGARALEPAAAPRGDRRTTSPSCSSMHTTQFNHAPAQIFMNTGHQIVGRPSMGSWLTYGLGSEKQGPARLRRPALRREPARRRQVVLGQRLSAHRSTRAWSSARRAIRCCSSRTPRA